MNISEVRSKIEDNKFLWLENNHQNSILIWHAWYIWKPIVDFHTYGRDTRFVVENLRIVVGFCVILPTTIRK